MRAAWVWSRWPNPFFLHWYSLLSFLLDQSSPFVPRSWSSIFSKLFYLVFPSYQRLLMAKLVLDVFLKYVICLCDLYMTKSSRIKVAIAKSVRTVRLGWWLAENFHYIPDFLKWIPCTRQTWWSSNHFTVFFFHQKRSTVCCGYNYVFGEGQTIFGQYFFQQFTAFLGWSPKFQVRWLDWAFTFVILILRSCFFISTNSLRYSPAIKTWWARTRSLIPSGN